MKRAALIAVLGGAGLVIGAAAQQPVYPPHGLDLAARDDGVKPGDDFFAFSNGRYLRTLQIPADQISAGKRFDMSKRIDDRVVPQFEISPRRSSLRRSDGPG